MRSMNTYTLFFSNSPSRKKLYADKAGNFSEMRHGILQKHFFWIRCTSASFFKIKQNIRIWEILKKFWVEEIMSCVWYLVDISEIIEMSEIIFNSWLCILYLFSFTFQYCSFSSYLSSYYFWPSPYLNNIKLNSLVYND